MLSVPVNPAELTRLNPPVVIVVVISAVLAPPPPLTATSCKKIALSVNLEVPPT